MTDFLNEPIQKGLSQSEKDGIEDNILQSAYEWLKEHAYSSEELSLVEAFKEYFIKENNNDI